MGVLFTTKQFLCVLCVSVVKSPSVAVVVPPEMG
jgi:hypothetical protein